MKHGGRVYELDTDALLADLQAMLLQHGMDVREQTPAGVWWFHSNEDGDAIGRRATEMFRQILAEHLREIEQ